MFNVDLGDTITESFILFVQTADAVLKYAEARFFKAGFSVIRYMVLQVIANNGGTITPSELAHSTLRERHDITTVVNRLKRDGLVRTERDNRDKRFVNVTMTAKGWKVLEQTTPVASEIVKQVMSSVTEDDAFLLKKLLGILRKNAHDGLESSQARAIGT